MLIGLSMCIRGVNRFSRIFITKYEGKKNFLTAQKYTVINTLHEFISSTNIQ